MSDPFADILRLTEARSIVSGGVRAGGTWALHFPRLDQIVFSAITEGSCWLKLDGRRDAIRIGAGDAGLLNGQTGFTLCSSVRAKPIEVEPTPTWNETTVIGDGTGCAWLAGRVTTNSELIARALPPLVLVRAGSPEAASLRWIANELVEEHASGKPGAGLAAAQLAQLFFVKILRASDDALPASWLRAMGDPRIARAMTLIHASADRPLGLDELARAAGMSRTRFALRFKEVAGETPLGYVTAWRMWLAQRALRDGAAISQVARNLGYASDSAFSTAFKRVIGVSPRVERLRRSSGR